MRSLAVVLLIVAALTGSAVPSSAATPTAAAAATTTTAPTFKRIAYGPDRLQVADVRTPAISGARTRRPAVIFLHGGGWVGGGPSAWSQEARAWTKAGWVTVNASYRLGGASGLSWESGRAMLDDTASVLALTRGLPRVDRSRVVVVGESAGGHLAGWLAGRYRSGVAGLILWSPVASPAALVRDAALDWPEGSDCTAVCVKQLSLAQRAGDIFGWSSRTTTGLSYLAQQRPLPTWVAGSADEWVRYDRNGALFCALAGPKCSAHVVPGTEHGSKLRHAHPELVTSMRRWATALVR